VAYEILRTGDISTAHAEPRVWRCAQKRIRACLATQPNTATAKLNPSPIGNCKVLTLTYIKTGYFLIPSPVTCLPLLTHYHIPHLLTHTMGHHHEHRGRHHRDFGYNEDHYRAYEHVRLSSLMSAIGTDILFFSLTGLRTRPSSLMS
jgi:hypothetical protein